MSKILKYTLTSMLLSIFMVNASIGQTTEPFANIVSIQHVCNGNYGAVEVTLNGDPSTYTYYWSHGPVSLNLAGLNPGFYTLVVISEFGCEELYEIEILDLSDCSMEIIVGPPTGPSTLCDVEMTVFAYNGGVPIDNSSFDVAWSNGETENPNIETVNTNTTYCVTVTPTGIENAECCVMTQCIEVQSPDPSCSKKSKCKLVVNETNRAFSGDKQYVELLVVCEGDCEEIFDLRDYIIDDNNGDLVAANEFITPFNFDNLGISEGFLTFKNIDSWKEVPNGSLILIYSETGKPHEDILAEDPDDANGDKVYIVAANNENYLRGKSGEWDNNAKRLKYRGVFISPKWEYLDIDESIDGLQARTPDGELMHGISLGESPFANDYDYPLWLEGISPDDSNCFLVGMDENNKEDFECHLATDGLQTPGLPNSEDNAIMIEELSRCRDRDTEYEEEVVIGRGNISLYPNPFTASLQMGYTAQIAEDLEIRIFTSTGQEVVNEKWKVEIGENQKNFRFGAKLPTGVYLVQVKFADGSEEHQKVIRIY